MSHTGSCRGWWALAGIPRPSVIENGNDAASGRFGATSGRWARSANRPTRKRVEQAMGRDDRQRHPFEFVATYSGSIVASGRPEFEVTRHLGEVRGTPIAHRYMTYISNFSCLYV